MVESGNPAAPLIVRSESGASGGAWRAWDGIELGRAWHWTDVRTTAGSGETLLLDLGAGPHTLDLAHREDGIRLDRVLITNVPTYVPGGTGG